MEAETKEVELKLEKAMWARVRCRKGSKKKLKENERVKETKDKKWNRMREKKNMRKKRFKKKEKKRRKNFLKNRKYFATLNLFMKKCVTFSVIVILRSMPGWFDCKDLMDAINERAKKKKDSDKILLNADDCI